MAFEPIISWQIDGEKWNILFFLAPKSLWMLTAAMKLKDACSLEEKLRQRIKKQTHHYAKVRIVKVIIFSVVTYECES